MNVEITIEKTNTLNFDMAEEQVSKMLAFAFGANARFNAQPECITHDDVLENASSISDRYEAEQASVKIPYKKPEVLPKSKVERMFGSDWRGGSKADDVQKSYVPSTIDGYKGFLLLDCPQCGKRKGFCTKTPIKTSYCSCGYEIELKEMKKARLNCKCGKTWSYMTNIEGQNFTHNCLNCNSPIDVIYNPRRRQYETLE